jgi:hypothetical protein
MADQATVAVATEKKRERRSWSTVLIDGSGSRLAVRLEKRKDGFKVMALHITGTGKKRAVTRGATSAHSAEAEAKKAQEAIVEAALKSGWAKTTPRGGFESKPDAFTLASLPKPKAKK